MKKFILFLCTGIVLQAAQTLPIEKSIISGKLDNGLNYHIIHNEKPKDKVEIRLIVHAGSLEEEEDQQGLAHFVEHMAFNGSRHFKKNELISYLESIGMRFGGDLNADTDFEWTTYKLSVPVKGDNLKKSLTVIRDWADGLNFNREEFNKERGVILSELRLRDTVMLRLFKQVIPVYYGGSAYMDRMPQGKKKVIREADVSRAKAFYDTWYRPELMDLVIAGDIDTTEMKKSVQTLFSSMKNNSHKVRTSRNIPESNQTKVFNVSDKELTQNSVALIYAKKNRALHTDEDKRSVLTEKIILLLFNLKAEEQLLKNNPKAQRMGATTNQLGSGRRSVEFYARHKEGEGLAALKELYTLLSSLDHYGFSKNNFELAKKKIHFEVEKAHKQLANLRSNDIADRLVKDIKYDKVYIDYEYDYNLTQKLLREITLEEVNKALKTLMQTKNRSFIFQNTGGEEIKKEELEAVLKEAEETAVDLSKTSALPTHLLSRRLPNRKILSKSIDKRTGIYHYRLENNITVDFKPSRFAKNRIVMQGYSFGGYSLLDDDDFNQIRHATEWIDASGYGKFTATQIKKILASKTVSVLTNIERFGEKITANANTEDARSMFELLYFKMTEPKLDPKIFENAKKIVRTILAQAKRDPQYRFKQVYSKFYFYNNPRIKLETTNDLEKLDREKMLTLYRKRFSDFNHFHFAIVGDMSPEEIEKFIGIYLANLPVEKREEHYISKPYAYRKGEQHLERDFNNEQSTKVTIEYRATVPYSVRNKMILSALSSIVNIRLRNAIREEKSGVYAVGVNTNMDPELKNKALLSITFDAAPKRADELIEATRQSLERVKKEGITQKELSAFKENIYIQLKNALKDNNYWLDMMMSHYKYDIPLSLIYDAKEIVESIKPKEVQEMAQKIFSEDSLTAKLTPEEK